MSSAIKHDGNKVRMELLAPEFLYGIASVLTFGAKKYAAGNWARGMEWSRPFGAMLRHLFAWVGGEREDKETGLSHLYHAGCCLMFLCAYEARGIGKNDLQEIGIQLPKPTDLDYKEVQYLRNGEPIPEGYALAEDLSRPSHHHEYSVMIEKVVGK